MFSNVLELSRSYKSQGFLEIGSRIRSVYKLWATSYHANAKTMSDAERASRMAAFENTDGAFLVATLAASLGLDNPNVRLVVHLTVRVDGRTFNQEMGRAGRDQRQAYCAPRPGPHKGDSEFVGWRVGFVSTRNGRYRSQRAGPLDSWSVGADFFCWTAPTDILHFVFKSTLIGP
jgi:superfamily II DNA/RNA helicase